MPVTPYKKQVLVIAFMPYSNGILERANFTTAHMLSKFVSDQQKDWDKYILVYLIMLAYRPP